jgi:hypothetical protein
LNDGGPHQSTRFSKVISINDAARNARSHDDYSAGRNYRFCSKEEIWKNTAQFIAESVLSFVFGMTFFAMFGAFGRGISDFIPASWRIAIGFGALALSFFLIFHGATVWIECEERRVFQTVPDGKAPQLPTPTSSVDLSASFPERTA